MSWFNNIFKGFGEKQKNPIQKEEVVISPKPLEAKRIKQDSLTEYYLKFVIFILLTFSGHCWSSKWFLFNLI